MNDLSSSTGNTTREIEPADPNDLVSAAVELDGIRNMIAKTGYAYDPAQNIFYSTMNQWQRSYGYCSLYDEAATPIGIVIDSEPIRFEYAGKKWLIELWKGQYGITLGGEIGIYNTAGPDLTIPGVFNGTFYNSVADEDTLNMAFTLVRDDKVLFEIDEKHWLLGGFVLGEYAKPSELRMEASIELKDEVMANAFLAALTELGYTENEFSSSGNLVSLTFSKPHSKQPLTNKGLIKAYALSRLKRYVNIYKTLTHGMTNMYEILVTLKNKSPGLYDLAVMAGKQNNMFSLFDTRLKERLVQQIGIIQLLS